MSELILKTQHLILLHSLVERVLPEQTHVLLKYQNDKNALLIAPAVNSAFKEKYKASLFMLKERNLKGDRSVAIHEILIDNDLNESDRELTFTEADDTLSITL